jgi:acetylglutamate kinase
LEAEVVRRFLQSVGQPADIDFYLGLFRAQKRESFAILVVDARVVRAALDSLHFDLRLLTGLGLTPVVLLGLIEPDDAEPQAERLREWLVEDQVRAEIVPAGPGANGGLTQALLDAIGEGVVPLVPIRAAPDRTVDDRFGLLGEIATALETRKIVFLGSRMGLGNPPLSVVSLSLDYDAALPRLSRRQASLLRQVRRLLEERVRHPLTVAITNPPSLLRELFTLKGAGTLVRRGVQVRRHDDLAAVDVPRLRFLVESSFDRPLVDDYFDRPVSCVYLVEGYQGAAVLTPSPEGPYLSKFAVERLAQGEGIGTDLWTALTREHPSFFWRSRPDNPITAWYAKQCDGLHRTPAWHVFWRGIEVERIPAVVRWALETPRDFAR